MAASSASVSKLLKVNEVAEILHLKPNTISARVTCSKEDEFTPAQKDYFAKLREFDERLRPFVGKPLVEGTDEHAQCESIWQERLCYIGEWESKHASAKKIDTPAKLLDLIEQRLVTLEMVPLAYGGGFPAEDARKYYKEAFDLAFDIAKSDPSLPIMPARVSDPRVGLDGLRQWCLKCRSTGAAKPLSKNYCASLKTWVYAHKIPVAIVVVIGMVLTPLCILLNEILDIWSFFYRRP